MKDKKLINLKNKVIQKIKNWFNNFNKKYNMEKARFNSFELLLVIIMSCIVGIFVGEVIFYNKDGNEKVASGTFSEVEDVYKTIIKDYYKDITEKDLSEAAIKGMMNLLNDDYSYYMDEEATKSFNEKLDGEFTGLGVEITLDDDKIPMIVTIFKGSAAEKYELKVNDRIIKVNDVDTKNKSLSTISDMIKGSKKEVTLIIKRDDEEITKKITTSKADIPSVTKEIYEKNNKKIGYIYISIFAQNTYEQFKNTLEELEESQIDALIIDVRSNSGGHLNAVTDILKLFLDKGTVMYQIKDNEKIEKYKVETKADKIYDYDIVVLTDGASASASEILASALSEQKNAILIGTTTYGKGTVQKTMQLKDGSMIKYTAEEWLTSKGVSINKKGVSPDINIELSDKYFETLDKADDNQLQKAIEVLSNK